jgi:hypothetical protein
VASELATAAKRRWTASRADPCGFARTTTSESLLELDSNESKLDADVSSSRSLD